MPAWLVSLTANIGAALVKWAVTEVTNELAKSREMAEQERVNGIRNGENAKRYAEAQTRADQIRAAIDMVNRNSV